MIITHLNEGPKAEYSLNGTVLTVHGVSIDLNERQKDIQAVVDISLGNDLKTAAEGVGFWYIATIVIPPREYELVESGQTDEEGKPLLVPQAKQVDLNKVELRLWALPNIQSAQSEGGNE